MLPPDDDQACIHLFSQEHYVIMDGVLYHLHMDKTWRIVPPTGDHHQLFDEAHGRDLHGHLRQAKILSEIEKHYWWPTMNRDVIHWCYGCLVCTTRNVGRKVRPPMTPVPVAGPFDKVGGMSCN